MFRTVFSYSTFWHSHQLHPTVLYTQMILFPRQLRIRIVDAKLHAHHHLSSITRFRERCECVHSVVLGSFQRVDVFPHNVCQVARIAFACEKKQPECNSQPTLIANARASFRALVCSVQFRYCVFCVLLHIGKKNRVRIVELPPTLEWMSFPHRLTFLFISNRYVCTYYVRSTRIPLCCANKTTHTHERMGRIFRMADGITRQLRATHTLHIIEGSHTSEARTLGRFNSTTLRVWINMPCSASYPIPMGDV